jgi:hypothetical protein
MAFQRYQPIGRAKIDWSNPITDGLAFAYSHGVAASGFCVNGLTSIQYASGSAKEVQAGYGLRSPSNRAYTLANNGITGTSYSLFALGSGSNGSNAQSAIDDDDGGTNTRRFQFRVVSNTVQIIPFNTSGGTTGVPSIATPLTAAEVARGYTMGAVVTPSMVTAWQNNQKATATPSGLPAQSGNVSIGARKTGAQGWVNGGLSLVAGWNRALTDAEMQSLAANPWQIFLNSEEEDIFIGSAAATPAGITGSLNATLGAVGLSGTGTTAVSGTASIALAALTAAGNGSTSDSGVLASTLGAATLNATGTVSAAGTLTATLAPLALSAAGTAATGGTLSRTLGAITLAGVGFVDSGSGQNGGSGVTGQIVASLQPVTLAAGGTVKAQGSADITLGGLGVSAAGATSIHGQAIVSLGDLSVSAYGGVPVTGGLQATLGELKLTATAGMFVFTRSLARTYVIQPESRRYSIATENRTYKIKP